MKSLKSGSIKGFLVGHVEKFMVAGVVVAFVMVAIGSVGSERLDFGPDTLSGEANQAGTAIDALPPVGEPEIMNYAMVAEGIRQPIPSVYTTPNRWDPGSPFLGDPVRESPDFLAVEELRADSGSSAVRLRMVALDEDADEEEKPKTQEALRWVVVVGKLPLKRQLEEYQVRFERSPFKDPMKDRPSYLFYEVERAEVGLWDAPGSEVWDKIAVMGMLETASRRFQGGAPDPVRQMYLAPQLPYPAFPMAQLLPPLIGNSFGEEIAHIPDIPFLPPEPVKRKPQELGPDFGVKDPEAEPEKTFEELMKERAERSGSGRMGGGMMGEMDGMMDGGMMGGYEGGMMGGGTMGGGYGSGGGSGGGYGSGYGAGMEEGGMMEDRSMVDGSGYGGMYGGMMGGAGRESTEFQLFRFFDYTVQPGRHYRYRVKLVLANPNYEVPPQYLAGAAAGEPPLDEGQLRSTDWSDTTETISVPLDSRILIASAKTSLRIETEPEAHIGVVRFDPETGDETFAEFDIGRGYYGNFLQIEVEEPEEDTMSSMYGGMGDMYGGMDMYGGSEEGDMGGYMSGMGGPTQPARRSTRRTAADREEIVKVDYLTETLLLDVMGGAKLFRNDSDATDPGLLLVMDADGNLLIRDELEDLEEYLEFNPPEVEKPTGMGAGGFPGMEMMDGGDYMGTEGGYEE